MSTRTLLLPLTCALVLAACTTEPAPPPSPSPTAAASELDATDLDREALAADLAALGATITELRATLEEAAAGGDPAAMERAAQLLVADVAAATEGTDAADEDPDPEHDGPAPILPGPLVSREESIQYGDLLTRTLAAARGAGSAGEPALRFLADPLAGDLGAWQRAAGDQLDAIADAASAGDLAAAEAAILELDGEAPRALAWVVHGLNEPTDAADAAGRALAHLAVIDLALAQLS